MNPERQSGGERPSRVRMPEVVELLRSLAAAAAPCTGTGTPDHIGNVLASLSMRVCLDAVDGPLMARGVATFRLYTRSLVKPS